MLSSRRTTHVFIILDDNQISQSQKCSWEPLAILCSKGNLVHMTSPNKSVYLHANQGFCRTAKYAWIGLPTVPDCTRWRASRAPLSRRDLIVRLDAWRQMDDVYMIWLTKSVHESVFHFWNEREKSIFPYTKQTLTWAPVVRRDVVSI